MNEDKKEFYKKMVIQDKTILGAASNTLKELAVRWPSKAQVLDAASDYLLQLRDNLTAEGWRGYSSKNYLPGVIKDVEAEIEEATINEITEADELARVVEEKRLAKEEALAEKERVKTEKAEKKAELEAARLKAEELLVIKEAEEKAIKKAELEAQLEQLEDSV